MFIDATTRGSFQSTLTTLLTAPNSKAALSKVKTKLDNQPDKDDPRYEYRTGPQARAISLSQPGYTKSILDQFGMTGVIQHVR